ncbi:extracellular catalytic domain type 2 short-chain-length polyhydroxyalkanoate depolymerase [Oceanospirillum sanctuarii]|uniref:extracellular catalytic domain type 2 short-chain-length polyhydroxyalkanoate depolymerase n=1 Tax=Oceanospirillum sanctuarii TaxID=1434821 RepID=UPI000A3B19AD|nr:PHB depolymerase family esterase [Oceanospirillum sanctuarii]
MALRNSFHFFRLFSALLCALVLGACTSSQPDNNYNKLPYLASLSNAKVTVSGFSSGGYMANQLHLAHPEEIEGAALFSAGPWGCAIKGLSHAMMSCMATTLPMISQQERMTMLHKASRSGAIGDPALLVDDPVYIFVGQSDTVVAPAVTESLITFYQTLVASYNLKVTALPKAGHGFPTLQTDAECGDPSGHHLQNCHFDGAGEALTTLYGQLQPASAPEKLNGNVEEFGQLEFFDGKGMLDRGYIYIPEACRDQDSQCQLHVSLHGCDQSAEVAGDSFIRNSGFNRWADSNNIVVLYPQAKKSLPNPKGCWDWWGYESEPFFSRNNQQVSAIVGMMHRLTGREE